MKKYYLFLKRLNPDYHIKGRTVFGLVIMTFEKKTRTEAVKEAKKHIQTMKKYNEETMKSVSQVVVRDNYEPAVEALNFNVLGTSIVLV